MTQDAHGSPWRPDQESVVRSLAEGRERLTRFMMCYEFAIREIETKISILQHEFQQTHRYNPIEHVTSRLKKPIGVLAKARKVGCAADEESLRAHIRDIAGVRVVCSFVGDVYRVQQLLCAQADVEVLEVKDYVAAPKESGYRSLHAIVVIPVFLSTGVERVPVEVQFRTIAQVFWASLEHKIFYKYDRQVPEPLLQELRQAATRAAELDATMEHLAEEIQSFSATAAGRDLDVSEEAVRDFLAFLDEQAGGDSGVSRT